MWVYNKIAFQLRGKKKHNSNPKSNLSAFNKIRLRSISQVLRALGPGLITGAADDDILYSYLLSSRCEIWSWNVVDDSVPITYNDCYTGDVCKNRSSKRKWFGRFDKEKILY